MIWLRGKSMRGRGGGRTRRGRGGSSCDRRCGVFASGDFVWEKSTPACVVVRQLWRGNKTCRLRVSRQLRCPKVSKGRAESPLVRPQAHTPVPERPDAPTTARLVGLPPRVGQYFLSKRKKVPKKARGTATTEAARPAVRNSQISAFRALPCPALVFAQACQSLTAFGSCAHWAHAPSRPKLRSAGAERLDAPNLFGASNSGR